MTPEPSKQWYDNLRRTLNKDPRYHMEVALLELTEQICKHYGPARGRYKLYWRIFYWVAELLIWRAKKGESDV